MPCHVSVVFYFVCTAGGPAIVITNSVTKCRVPIIHYVLLVCTACWILFAVKGVNEVNLTNHWRLTVCYSTSNVERGFHAPSSEGGADS